MNGTVDQPYYKITQDKQSKMYTHEIEYYTDHDKKAIARIYRFYMIEVFLRAIINLETRLKHKVSTNGTKLTIKFISASNEEFKLNDILKK